VRLAVRQNGAERWRQDPWKIRGKCSRDVHECTHE
jgi:hypothetical protein